jgi:hypothetical protein
MSSIAGKFLGRDPIGFKGGWNQYSFVNNQPFLYVDPFGLLSMDDNYVPPVTQEFPDDYPVKYGWPTSNGRPIWLNFPAYTARRCIFRSEPFLNPKNGGINEVPINGGVTLPFRDQADLLRNIIEKKCCEVIFAGHSGPSPWIVEDMVSCDDTEFADKLRQAFKDAGCSNCTLVAAACGRFSRDLIGRDMCRDKLASRSGCTVFGTKMLIPYFDHDDKDSKANVIACTLDPNESGKRCPRGNGVFVNFPFYPYPSSDPLTPSKAGLPMK